MGKATRQLIILIALIGIGLLYAYYAYLFAPKWESIKLLKQHMQEKQSRYELLIAYEQDKYSLNEKLTQLKAKTADLLESTPHRIDKPKLAIDIYTVAKLNQVQPHSLTFGAFQTIGSTETQSLIFTCTGSEEGIIKMIDDLQFAEDQRYTLESLMFTNNDGILSGELFLIAYASKVGRE